MTIKIGQGGYVKLQGPDEGPRRQVQIVSFKGASAAGEVAGPHFRIPTDKISLRAVIDVDDGKNRTTEFRDTGAAAGDLHLSQLDTGPSGHTMWAIYTDTGT